MGRGAILPRRGLLMGGTAFLSYVADQPVTPVDARREYCLDGAGKTAWPSDWRSRVLRHVD